MEGNDKHDAKCRDSVRGFFPDCSRQGPNHVYFYLINI